MSTTPSKQQLKPCSVLVVGASGLTGLACIRALSQKEGTKVHGFCRNPTKLDPSVRALCTSVIAGNAHEEKDIESALISSNANWIIISIGNGESVAKDDIRAVSAKVIHKVLLQPSFQHIRVVVVSSTGAGPSKIIVGMGIGQLITFYLRHILVDHSEQEAVFGSPELHPRTTIVRATALTDNRATGKLVTYGDTQKTPSIHTDRADLAKWIVEDIHKVNWVPSVVNVTGAK
jgi:hypothetical protein